MGATNVKVMNGGYPKWVAEKRATEEGEGKPGPAYGQRRTRPDGADFAGDGRG